MPGMLFPLRVAAALVTVFSGLGLLLAAVGLYGIIAFAVTAAHARDRDPHGHRRAPGGVVRLVLRQGLGLAAAGLIVGSLLGALATRMVAGGALRRQRRRPDRMGNGGRGTVGGRDGRQRRPRLSSGENRPRASAKELIRVGQAVNRDNS